MTNLAILPTITTSECPACKGYVHKAGPGCQSCPAFKDTHFVASNQLDYDTHLVVLGDVPELPWNLMIMQGSVHVHPPFREDGIQVLRSAISKGSGKRSNISYLYAVKCGVDNPNKAMVTACQTPLLDEFAKIFERREQRKLQGPVAVIACGLTAVHALGIHAKSFGDVQGRVFETTFGGMPIHVVVTLSLKAIAASAGKYSSIVADVQKAFNIIANNHVIPYTKPELEKSYRYPKSNLEVQELVDLILGYHRDGTQPQNWAISLDTETNTLHPHRDGTKLLTVTTAWDTGLAASFALWHPMTKEWCVPGYDIDAAWKQVQRLLHSDKPKILHNAGYDLKVIWKHKSDIENIVWDDFLAEHSLEEDKKGQYKLKFLVKQDLPVYAGYEDKLQEFLEKEEGTDQTKSILAAEGGKLAELKLPTAVADALLRMELPPKFRAKTLQKTLDALLKDPEENEQSIRDAKFLLAAKEAGEFVSKKTSKKKEQEGGFEKVPLDELSFYGCVDADVTRQLGIGQKRRMKQEDKELRSWRITEERNRSVHPHLHPYTIDILCTDPNPLIPLVKSRYVPRMRALADMEYRGIKVDRVYMKEAEGLLEKAIGESERQIFELTGERFKIGSNAKLANFLCTDGRGFFHPNMELARQKKEKYPGGVEFYGDRVVYAPVSRTKRNAIQMTEKVLKSYIQKYECPLSNLILSHRKASKARGTFLKNVDILSSLDGAIHSRFNLTGTSTGRLSSSNLNLQNVPKGEMGGVKCKKLFIPDDDSMAFCNADAKGAEVVIFSAYSRDAALIEALRNGLDAHCFFSSEVLNPDKVAGHLAGEARKVALLKAGIDDDHAWSYDDFFLGKDGLHPDKEYGSRLKVLRDNIKRVVFGILYGAGYRKIAEIAGIEEAFAKTIIDLLFGMFRTIPNFIERTKWELSQFGLVETYHGRRRRFLIKGAPKSMISKAQRQAVNFKIQATNSDIVLDVLCDISEVIRRDMGGRMLLTVHDSLGFQVPKKYLSQIPDLFREYGTKRVNANCPWLPVTYRWDLEAGPSYGELVPLTKYMDTLQEAAAQSLEAPISYEGYTEEEMYEDLKVAALEEEESGDEESAA